MEMYAFFLSLSSYPAGSWTEYMFTDFRRGSNFAPPVPPQTHFRLEAPQLTLFGRPFGRRRVKCLHRV